MARYYEFQQQPRQHSGEEIFIKPHLVSRWLDQIVHHPDIVDVVEQVIGPDIVLRESDWSVKRGGTGDYVPWHQDSPYWNLSTDDVVSIWLAFDDVNAENGAMKVVLGSHAQGQIGRADHEGGIYDAYQAGQRMTDPEAMFRFGHLEDDYSERAVSVDLDTGEFSIHSVNLIHGGGPNPADRDRIGFVMRYMSAVTRYRGHVDSVTAIRGRCEQDYYELESRPTGEFEPADLAALDHALNFPSGSGRGKRKH